MTVWPVIVRELRSQSRQPLTYWLRVVAAVAVIAVLGLMLVAMAKWEHTVGVAGRAGLGGGVNPFSNFGTLLFGFLNATLFACNCLLAPLLTADCISREKREGTLGLLFLTQLNARGIVMGKAFAHTLRGLTIFLAMLPVLAIPVLLGGVSGKDCLMALLIDGIALVLGLAAGFLASAFNRDWVRSFVLAEFLSVFLVLGFMTGHFRILTALISGPGVTFHLGRSLLDQFVQLFCFHTNVARASSVWTGGSRPTISFKTTWSEIWASVPNVQNDWFALMAVCLAGALLFFVGAILLAAWRIRSSWRQEPATRKASALQRSLTRPRFGVGVLRRRLSRSLDRNPIGWLQHYSWAGRITKWGWCAFIIAVESFLISDLWEFADFQPWLVLLFLAGMAFTASASFRTERESGALELLLVCPLSVSQIIMGRLRGIWMQFLPSAAFLALCIHVGSEIEENRDKHLLWWFLFLAFATLPVIGLFFSMTRTNFMVAWLLTLLTGIVVPILFAAMPGILGLLFQTEDALRMMFLAQIVVGALFWRLLYSRLQSRRFAFAHVTGNGCLARGRRESRCGEGDCGLRNKRTMNRRTIMGFKLSLGVAFFVGLNTFGADWPQWRGLKRNGHSPETGLAQQWPAAGPPLAWKTNGLGAGYSSVSVANGRIFTMGDRSDSSFIHAFDLQGKPLWSSKVGKPGGGGGYPGPRCTPAVDGELVYALGQYGDVVCVEAATGNEVWRKNLTKEFGGKVGGWGYSESPLIDEDQLICTPGGRQGTLLALNKKTGAKTWQSFQWIDSAEYSSVIAAEIGDKRHYVQLTGESVGGVAADSGKLLWRVARPGQTAIIPTPIFHQDHVYVSSGYGVGCNLFKITSEGSSFKADKVYANKVMVNHHGGVVLVGEHLYGYSDGKGWVCQDFKTGEMVWSDKSLGKGSIAYADGRLYLRSEGSKGTVALIEAKPEAYKEHGRFDQPNRTDKEAWPHPVIAGGRLYLRDQDLLLCYDIKAK